MSLLIDVKATLLKLSSFISYSYPDIKPITFSYYAVKENFNWIYLALATQAEQ